MTADSTGEPGIRPGRAPVDGHGRGVVVKLLIRGPLAAWLASSVESVDDEEAELEDCFAALVFPVVVMVCGWGLLNLAVWALGLAKYAR